MNSLFKLRKLFASIEILIETKNSFPSTMCKITFLFEENSFFGELINYNPWKIGQFEVNLNMRNKNFRDHFEMYANALKSV